MSAHEAETVRAMLNELVAEGLSYPQAEPLTVADFAAYWQKGEAFVVRTGEGTLSENLPPTKSSGRSILSQTFRGGVVISPTPDLL